MENLSKKQQAMWPVIETGRQIKAAILWPLKKWAEYGVEVDRRNALALQLEQLTDEGLLDRIVRAERPGTSFVEAARGLEEFGRAIRSHNTRVSKSIDGILRAV